MAQVASAGSDEKGLERMAVLARNAGFSLMCCGLSCLSRAL
ncbi:hypothetical protein PAMC26510_33185 [Caballeronia sordidicola]|uniref:Uncharacterized protein n=1 Tax=Caballeronia sordidicola TaxID=196367 RepID=A0A242M6N9_CABSO|nr:hypothetical protein PAMC26510_33185 [Caballeronia sordidicola]